jgi:hypothetical protein
MILAKELVALTSDGKTHSVAAYTEIQNIKRATDHGYWFDVAVNTFCQKSWRRVWAKDVQVLRD